MTKNIEKQDDFEEDYFSVLSNTPFSSEKYKEEYGLIVKLLHPKPGDNILDMGCGKGQLGLFLLDKEPKCKLTFSDISSQASNYLRGFNFIKCSMESTPFFESNFDKIYSLSTISHVPNINEAIREMYRITKRGGGDINNNK